MSPDITEARHVPAVIAILHGEESERTKGLGRIIAAHWKPLYKYLRLQYRLPSPEASAVILNFLELLQEPAFYSRFDPARQHLKEFIRQKLDVFEPTPAAKRAAPPSPYFDFTNAEEEFQADQRETSPSAAEYYSSEWVRSLLTLAVEELNNKFAAAGKTKDFSLFMKHDLQNGSGNERISLESIATELSMTPNEASCSLAGSRQQFQNILMDLIRSFTSSDAEFRREAKAFFRT